MDDNKEIDMQHFMKMLLEAQEQAVERGIDANTIVINKNLRYIKPFSLASEYSVKMFPPAIMGMELKYAKLPQDSAFMIFQANITEREKRKAEIKQQAREDIAKKITRLLLECTTPCCNRNGEPIIAFDPSFYDKLNRLVYEEKSVLMDMQQKAKDNTVDGDTVGMYDGIITIICIDSTEGQKQRVKKIFITAQGLPCDKKVTLNDCLKAIEFNGDGIVSVIMEEPLKGMIYEYGNYGNHWVHKGATIGYA